MKIAILKREQSASIIINIEDRKGMKADLEQQNNIKQIKKTR